MANDPKMQQKPAAEPPKHAPSPAAEVVGEPPGAVDTAARIAQLEAEVARLKAGQVKAALAPEHRGTKTYRLSKPHYRKGVMHAPGDTITVTDEKPGKSWTLVEAGAKP